MSPLTTFAFLLAGGLAVALWVTLHRSNQERIRQQRLRTESEQALTGQLDQAHAERNRLLDALSEAFLLIDSQGLIHFANQAAHDLFEARSLANRTIREAFTDPRLANAVSHGLASGKASSSRITLPQQASPLREQEKRGLNSWIVDVAPMPDAGHSPPMSRVIIRDITAEQQTEQIRKDFVANASHELRTPMAIIQGYLENLLDDEVIEDRETTRKFLNVMRKHSDRMSHIIEDMLVISRLESGEEGSLKIEPFNLKECVQDIIERLESLIRAQEAVIEIKLSDEAITVHGDRYYWAQALFNLVENALKQNPRPGLRIEIGCDIRDGKLQIWVIDDGIGIPSADLPFVFRRFYRVDKQHNQSEIKGTGLGLSIVKRAIEAHNGSIEATSVPGTETKFVMTMPLQGDFKQTGTAGD